MMPQCEEGKIRRTFACNFIQIELIVVLPLRVEMKNLEDFVYVSNVFSSEFCDSILSRIESEDRNWVKHTWYNESLHRRNEKFSGVDQDYKELDVLYHNNNNFTEIEQELIPFLVRSCEDY